MLCEHVKGYVWDLLYGIYSLMSNIKERQNLLNIRKMAVIAI